MRKLYYSCGFGFHTFDLIHIINNDNLSEIGCIFYDEKNYIWKEE